MKIAFYTGTRPGLQSLFNRFVRFWTTSHYSHCEAVFGNDLSVPVLCASSSFLDGGVRTKMILLDPAHWDVLDLPTVDSLKALDWFAAHSGQKYDVRGLLSVVSPVREDKAKWFCSEAIAASIGYPEPWRLDPQRLYDACLFVGASVVTIPEASLAPAPA